MGVPAGHEDGRARARSRDTRNRIHDPLDVQDYLRAHSGGVGPGARPQLQPSLARRICARAETTFTAGPRGGLPVTTTRSPAFSAPVATPAAARFCNEVHSTR